MVRDENENTFEENINQAPYLSAKQIDMIQESSILVISMTYLNKSFLWLIFDGRKCIIFTQKEIEEERRKMEEEARELEAMKRKAEEEARLEAEKQRLEEIVRQQEAEKEERRRMAAELKRKAEALKAEEREREEERKKKQRTQEGLQNLKFR